MNLANVVVLELEVCLYEENELLDLSTTIGEEPSKQPPQIKTQTCEFKFTKTSNNTK